MSASHLVPLDDGSTLEASLSALPLGARWWSWTEWKVEAVCGFMVEVPVANHRVLPLGYPDELHGQLLAYVEDGRFIARSPMSLFPILNDLDAIPGAVEAQGAALESCAIQASLL